MYIATSYRSCGETPKDMRHWHVDERRQRHANHDLILQCCRLGDIGIYRGNLNRVDPDLLAVGWLVDCDSNARRHVVKFRCTARANICIC